MSVHVEITTPEGKPYTPPESWRAMEAWYRIPAEDRLAWDAQAKRVSFRTQAAALEFYRQFPSWSVYYQVPGDSFPRQIRGAE